MINRTIHHYEIKSELGRGGMATVYLAKDQKFETNVAIKVLNQELVLNDNIRKRFLAEARNMYRMSHPNIIKVTDLIDENVTVAFVMEYIDGETLKEYLERKGRQGDTEIRDLFSQMLEAVGYVHEQNLVHRDIKPSNFIIDRSGKIKLLDFGIAKKTDASSAEYTQTGTSAQMGTPMYMSPEQITETKNVTAQSDIYSLGVVLWQMVTGQKPYDTKTLSHFQLQLKIVNDSLLKTNTQWDQLIQESTFKDIEDRYSNIIELKQKLRTISVEKGFLDDQTELDDKTTLNKAELLNRNSLHTCPRCIGKGHVDLSDIKRLNMELFWAPGACAYCEGKGKVSSERLNDKAIDDVNLTTERIDHRRDDATILDSGTDDLLLNDLFKKKPNQPRSASGILFGDFYNGKFGYSILEELLTTSINAFQRADGIVKWNGEIPRFAEQGWKSIPITILSSYSGIKNFDLDRLRIIWKYQRARGWLVIKEVEVYLVAYYHTSLNNDGFKVLLFIKTEGHTNIVSLEHFELYEHSLGISDKIHMVKDLQVKGSFVQFDCYFLQNDVVLEQSFKYELDDCICRVINEIWSEMDGLF
jgi:serine/threonine protein kinase